MITEDDSYADAHRAAMDEVLRLLTPLRNRRQANAERRRREAEAELLKSSARMAAVQRALVTETDKQVVQRQELTQEHLERSLTLLDVDRWHDRERGLLNKLARLRQDLQQQALDLKRQQEATIQTRHDARAAVRAVEKLACLNEALNDES